jgi:bifunctional non-homologous end joining protein LigD
LFVGYNSPDRLVFAGRVGSGFSEKLLASIDAQLQKDRRVTCPFINLPEKHAADGARDYSGDAETLPLG